MLKGDFEIISGKIAYADIGLRPQGRLAVKVDLNTEQYGELRFECLTDNAHSVIDTLLRIMEEPDFGKLKKMDKTVSGRRTFGEKRLCAIGCFADYMSDNNYDRIWLLEDGTVEREAVDENSAK
jgi:hypothetical protein